MKKCRLLTSALLTLLFIIGTGSAYGQTYVVNEGFEGETFPPDGWTTIDNDGDGHCWTVAGKGKATLSGEKIAISYTVNPENGSHYGAQDNYLVTPKISVTNAAFKLSFKYCAEDDETVEKLQVLVSETGTSAADFTKVVKDITVDNGYDGVTLQSTELSLTEYAGKEIYIALTQDNVIVTSRIKQSLFHIDAYCVSLRDGKLVHRDAILPLTTLSYAKYIRLTPTFLIIALTNQTSPLYICRRSNSA